MESIDDVPTCTYVPDMLHSWFDDDDVEHDEPGVAAVDYGNCDCSHCGFPMMGGPEGWFDEQPGEHGGLKLTPRFEFCPKCGRKVVAP